LGRQERPRGDGIEPVRDFGTGVEADDAGRTDEEIATVGETLKLRTAKLGPDHPDTLQSRNNLAAGYLAVAISGIEVGSATAQDAVKIGVVIPMTGAFAAVGREVAAGAKLYIQRHGDTVVGQKIELIIRDDAGVPDAGKRLAQELIVKDKVSFLGAGITPTAMAMAAKPEILEWAGSHLAVTFSPDNKFLVTAMHEPALHGWRLADNRHMRMTGYPGRVRSMSWSAGGKALATSGADTVILWPFASKDGPMGKEPAMLAPLQARVSAVACHPKQDIFAAGYSDGTVLMVRMEDGAEILVRRNGTAPVAALAWNARGTHLAFAAEDGDSGLLEF